MDRLLRLGYPGAVYTVTSLGNARQDIVADDWVRTLFLERLVYGIDCFGWCYYAFCLMG